MAGNTMAIPVPSCIEPPIEWRLVWWHVIQRNPNAIPLATNKSVRPASGLPEFGMECPHTVKNGLGPVYPFGSLLIATDTKSWISDRK